MVQARGRVRSKAIEKRQRILDGAAKMLVAKGAAAITLQDVANEIGIYAASIYYYFPSREELIKEVMIASLQRYLSNIEAALGAIAPEALPIEKIKCAIRAAVESSTSLDDYAVAYARAFDQAPIPQDDDVRKARHDVRALWLKLLSDAQNVGQIAPSVDLYLLRFVIMGATRWISYWYTPNGLRTPEEISAAFTAIVLHGAAGQQVDISHIHAVATEQTEAKASPVRSRKRTPKAKAGKAE